MRTSKRHISPEITKTTQPKKLKDNNNTSENLEVEMDNGKKAMEVKELETKIVTKSEQLLKALELIPKAIDTIKVEDSINEHKVGTSKQDVTDNADSIQNLEQNVSTESQKQNGKTDSENCNNSGQFLNSSDTTFYQVHPQNALSILEIIAKNEDENILLTSCDEPNMERELYFANITNFSIFDERGQLCPLDGDLIENQVNIYMSGYLKSIFSESAEIDDESVPVKDIGPIIGWVHGPDFGSTKPRHVITVSTENERYQLLKPSEQYTALMSNLYEKIWLSKVVVEYLQEYRYLEPTYADLLELIRASSIPVMKDTRLTEEMLHKHSQFVCDQVASLEVDEDSEPLITLPCMRHFTKLMGTKFDGRKFCTKIDYRGVVQKSRTIANTTPRVSNTFKRYFTDQYISMDPIDNDFVERKKTCMCKACQLTPNCGQCNACRAMPRFGGHGSTKKDCIQKFCANIAIEQAEDSDPDNENKYRRMAEILVENLEDTEPIDLTASAAVSDRNVQWIGEPTKIDGTNVYYEKVEIDGSDYSNGDFVMVKKSQSTILARVVYMWRDAINTQPGFFHAQVFYRASDTVLGEVSDPKEVFLGDDSCAAASLSSILRKACVEQRENSAYWYKPGGETVAANHFEDSTTYFYNKCYDKSNARFEDLPLDLVCTNPLMQHRFCPSCERKSNRVTKNIPRVFEKLMEKSSFVTESNRTEWSLVKWQDCDYKKGCGVFLQPGTFQLKDTYADTKVKPTRKKVNLDIYPEYYRKSAKDFRRAYTPPFCVGYIAAITTEGEGPLIASQGIYLKVNILYRPENTTIHMPQNEDLNVVYWSEEILDVPFCKVVGACHLIYKENIPPQFSLAEWLARDPNRFYFSMAFDECSGQFIDVPHHATSVGRIDTGNAKRKYKGKGKGKGKSSSHMEIKLEHDPVRPLKTLDVFAGCGGLSEGLRQAGVAECRWAIESVKAAARAYALNNENCIVFNEDCNALLNQALSGATSSVGGLCLPQQGEVELLVGTPPCHGFSGMKKFNSITYTNFQNSLVATYLSYCDYYRPKYFILENVRNFVSFKKGMVLKVTLRALLDMGYQCTFGILQAGNYGVPQLRRRLIILAAAPGYKLPLYPEPTHAFTRNACSAIIDGQRYWSNIRWNTSAPRRTLSIRDAMSDLPRIGSGTNNLEIEYGSMPHCHFQRLMRSKDESTKLRDHICKDMEPLIQARICRVPTTPGSDWRDLPNESVTLSDGTECKVLQYRHRDTTPGRERRRVLRGVCACASGHACSPADKQHYTLIPWCLPHTANRNDNWQGLYGRVCWDDYFRTTPTNPEPMSNERRVLHPDANRVVSVRECARSQGFPDTYIFAGSIQDKHRQVAHAVPPPLSAAIGREIMTALVATLET